MGNPNPKQDNNQKLFITEDMHIPAKYACTGNIDTLMNYLNTEPVLGSDGNPLPESGKAYLQGKINIIEELNKSLSSNGDMKVIPKKAIKYGNDGVILDLPHQPEKQMTGACCWAMPTVLMLQSRGIDIDQNTVLNYRPDISAEASERIAKDNQETYASLNTNTYSNISYTAGLIQKCVPNSSLSQLKYKKVEDFGKNEAALKYFRLQIKEALEKHGSPVSVLVGKHYRTIVGIDGDDILLKDSNTNNPDLNEKHTLTELLGNVNINDTIEFSYMKDITLGENGDIPKELEKYKSVLKKNDKGGYIPLNSEEINNRTIENNNKINELKIFKENNSISEEEYNSKTAEIEKERKIDILQLDIAEDHVVLGSTNDVVIDGVTIEIGETIHIPKEFDEKAANFDWDPNVYADTFWKEKIKEKPEIANSLFDGISGQPLYDAKQVLNEESQFSFNSNQTKEENAQTKQAESQDKKETYAFEIKDGALVISSKVDLSKKSKYKGPKAANLNNPPLETGKELDLNKFRELQKKTKMGPEYDEMFRREEEYARTLPDGPLKKMTEMSIDARNAIKVLSTDPTPENRGHMRDYAKIIIAQKLLAIEHACSNGMGVTERGFEQKGAKWFLSDALVTKLTDQVIDFSKPDYEKQLDEFLLHDKGMEKLESFVRNSINNSNALQPNQKDSVHRKVSEALDVNHDIDRMKDLLETTNFVKNDTLKDPALMNKYKTSINKAIEIRSSITPLMSDKDKLNKYTELGKLYDELEFKADSFKDNSVVEKTNEENQAGMKVQLTEEEAIFVVTMNSVKSDFSKRNADIVKDLSEKVAAKEKADLQAKQEQELKEKQIAEQKKINLEKYKYSVEEQAKTADIIHGKKEKGIPSEESMEYVAGVYGSELEKNTLTNSFEAQLCVLGAPESVFREYGKTLPNGSKFSDRQLKDNFINNLLNNPGFANDEKVNKFINDNLKTVYGVVQEQHKAGQNTNIEKYIKEANRTVLNAYKRCPGTYRKAALLNEYVSNTREVIKNDKSYKFAAKTLKNDKFVMDRIKGAYDMNEMMIDGIKAKQTLLNETGPNDPINKDTFCSYMAGLTMLGVYNNRPTSNKDEVDYNSVSSDIFEKYSRNINKTGKTFTEIIKDEYSKSVYIDKLVKEQPKDIRDGLIWGDSSFNKMNQMLYNGIVKNSKYNEKQQEPMHYDAVIK